MLGARHHHQQQWPQTAYDDHVNRIYFSWVDGIRKNYVSPTVNQATWKKTKAGDSVIDLPSLHLWNRYPRPSRLLQRSKDTSVPQSWAPKGWPPLQPVAMSPFLLVPTLTTRPHTHPAGPPRPLHPSCSLRLFLPNCQSHMHGLLP